MSTPSAVALSSLSNELADAVEKAGASIVRVDDGTRLTASGLIWSSSGVIVATSHGVERDDDVSIALAGGKTLAARVVGRDPESDIAVLRVDATDLPAAEVAADTVRVGSLAAAVARPGRGDLQATLGIVTSRLEAQDSGRPEYILGTDAKLLPGFSGGALIDMNGRVIGVLNLMFGRRAGVALGVSLVANVVEALLAHGKIKRGYLGVGAQVVELSAALRKSSGVDRMHALLIVHIHPGSPAESAGIGVGDILVSIGEAAVSNVEDLQAKLRRLSAGETVTAGILRGGVAQTVAVTLGDADEASR
jgi:serine protease DegQ